MNRLTRQAPFLLLLLTGAVYCLKLANGFQWDDFHFIVRDRFVQDPANLINFFLSEHNGLYRPLRATVYLLLHLVSGGRPVGYQLAGIAFHLATVLLVYLLLRRLSKSSSLGLMVAALYGVHPLLTGRVVNITGSLDIPGVTLALASFLLYLKSEDRPDKSGSLIAASVLVCAAGLLYSEEALTVLPLIIWYRLTLSPRRETQGPGRLIWSFTPFVLVTVGYLVVRTLVLDQIGRGDFSPASQVADIMATTVVFWHYVLRLLFPVHLSPAYGLTASQVPVQSVGLAVFSIFILLAVLVFLIHRKRPEGFFLGWFFIALIPFANIVPIGGMMADRYCYHAAIGFISVIVCSFSALLPTRARQLRWPFIVVMICFTALTLHRIRLWSAPLNLWRNAVQNAEKSYPARINYGIALRDSGDLTGSMQQFETAHQMEPKNPLALVNIGQLKMEEGEYDLAAYAFEQALKKAPDNISALSGMANLLVIAKKHQEAQRICDRLLALDEHNVAAINVLAYIAYQQGNLTEASRLYSFVRDQAYDRRLIESAIRNLETITRETVNNRTEIDKGEVQPPTEKDGI